MARTLRVEIIGDASSYQRALGTAKTETTSFAGTIAGTFGKAAAFAGLTIGAAELIKFGTEAIQAAGKVQKSTEAIHANFGKAADSVLKFTDNASKLGLSANDAEAAATQFGILFKNMGIGVDSAAKMTVGFEQLAAALSAVKGTDPAAVLNALTLAAAGNTRGLKQLGITLDSAQIKAEAFKLGLIKTRTEALTPGEKAQAIYALATKNLGEWQKQAAAHSGDLTNKQRVLNAEWENAKEKLGAALLPALTRLVTIMADNLPGAISAVTTGIRALAPVFELWKTMMLAVLTPMRVIIDLIHGDWSAAWDAAQAPVLAAVGVIRGVFDGAAGWFVTAGGDLVNGLWGGIQSAWAAPASWFSTIQTLFVGYFNGAVSWLTQAGTDVLTGMWTAITSVWATVAGWFGKIQSLFVGFFVGASTWLLAEGHDVLTGMWTGIQNVWATVSGWFSGIAGKISGYFSGAGNWLLSEGSSIMSGLEDGLKAGWQPITGWLSKIPGFVGSFFGGAGKWLYDAGAAVIQGLWDGMKAVWDKVTGWLSGLGGVIGSLKGPVSKDLVLLQPQGRAIIAGLHKGMRDGMPALERFVAGIGPSMSIGNVGGGGGFGGSKASAAGGLTVNLHVGTMIGGNPEQVAKDLSPHIHREFARYAARNGTVGYT